MNPFDDKHNNNLLQKGDVFLLEQGHCFCAKLPKQLTCSNNDFDFSLCHSEVRIDKTIQYGLNTSIFEGLYQVIRTAFDGGGGRPGDEYSDGHHVFARRIIKRIYNKIALSDFEIDFYQTGAFSCVNENVRIIECSIVIAEVFKEGSELHDKYKHFLNE